MTVHAVFLQWMLFLRYSPTSPKYQEESCLSILPNFPYKFLVKFMEEKIFKRIQTTPLYVVHRAFILSLHLTPHLKQFIKIFQLNSSSWLIEPLASVLGNQMLKICFSLETPVFPQIQGSLPALPIKFSDGFKKSHYYFAVCSAFSFL